MLKRAFTLVELVIVMVIIGILGAIALPQLGYFKDRAHESRVEAVKNNLEKNLNMLRQEENPSLGQDCDELLSTFGGVRNLDDWNIASHDDSCAFTYNKLDRTIVLPRDGLNIEESSSNQESGDDHNSYPNETAGYNGTFDEAMSKFQEGVSKLRDEGSSTFFGHEVSVSSSGNGASVDQQEIHTCEYILVEQLGITRDQVQHNEGNEEPWTIYFDDNSKTCTIIDQRDGAQQNSFTFNLNTMEVNKN